MGAATAAAMNPLPELAGGATVPLHMVTGQEESTPRWWTVTELQRDDPIIQAMIPADQKLIVVYRDNPSERWNASGWGDRSRGG